MSRDDVRDFARNLIAAECYIDEPYEEGDPAYDVLSPRSQKEVRSLVERLMRKVTQYGDQRERAGQNKGESLGVSHSNDAYHDLSAPTLSMWFNNEMRRLDNEVAELKAKKVKDE